MSDVLSTRRMADTVGGPDVDLLVCVIFFKEPRVLAPPAKKVREHVLLAASERSQTLWCCSVLPWWHALPGTQAVTFSAFGRTRSVCVLYVRRRMAVGLPSVHDTHFSSICVEVLPVSCAQF